MISISRSAIAGSLCGLFLCLPAGTQQAQPQQPPAARITVSVNEVIVPVTVTDDKGRFVSNLEARDFRILDEGRPQRISFFSHDQRQPVVVGFLVDLSNSTKTHWKTYQDAIKELIWGLLPGDKRYTGYLISYSNDAEVVVNTTWEGDKLTEEVSKMKPGGGAALYDAIYKACSKRELVEGEPYQPRRVIVIVGDGHDTASQKTLNEVLELAQRSMVTIYAVSTQAFGFNNEFKDVLERLTTETGGHVEYPLDSLYKDVSGYLSVPSDEGNYALKVGTGGYAAEISAAIIKAVGGIQGEVTTQYVLRYNPDVDPEAKPKLMRRIRVEVPTLPGVKIRARGYYYPNVVPGASPGPNGQ